MYLLIQRCHSVGQPVGSHADSGQAENLQLTDLAGQGSHDCHLRLHQLFNPRRIILRKAADEGGKVGLMIITAKPLLMPALER
jgi:hypothetical protein